MVWDLVQKCTIQVYFYSRASGSDEGARPERNQNAKRSIRPQTRNRSQTRRKKKAESTKLNVVPETFTQRSSLPGPRREGVAVFEKSGDCIYDGDTPYIYVQGYDVQEYDVHSTSWYIVRYIGTCTTRYIVRCMYIHVRCMYDVHSTLYIVHS